MQLKICDRCKKKTGYVTTEPPEKCECGGVLRDFKFENMLDPYGSGIHWVDKPE